MEFSYSVSHIKFRFLSQKCSVTKWCKIILTKYLCIWGVNFRKLTPIKMLLKRTRDRRVVKNLTARLALVFILSQIKHSDFWHASNLLIKKSDIFILPKSRAKRAVDCPFGSIFSQEHQFSNYTCFSHRWGQEPFFKREKKFLFAFSSVLEPNGQWKCSLPEWLSFENEAIIGGKSSSISIL